MTSTGRHLDEIQAGIPNAPSKRADLYGRSYCERHQGQQPKGRTQRPDIWAHRSRMGSAEEKSALDRGVVPHMGIPRVSLSAGWYNAHCVRDFADAACILSERQLELSSRRVTDLVVLAQKTTIIALDAGSSIPTPPQPIPDRPDQAPLPSPRGPRTPYPVNDPDTADPGKPGSEPDYIPSPIPGIEPPAI